MSRLIGIYGASGFGREVLPVLLENEADPQTRVCFIDDNLSGSTFAGYPVLDWLSFLAENAKERFLCIAIADGVVRQAIFEKCVAAGISFIECCARNVWRASEARIGEGSILQPFVNITSNAVIGRCFHANIYSYVAHDCIIGDFVTFAPGVHCNGNVHIGDHAYLGTGAIIKQGGPDNPLIIGANAVIGMGAVVTKDVPPGVTVVGNPARQLVRK